MTAPTSMFSAALLVPAMRDAVKKLKPRDLARNPVMFVTASRIAGTRSAALNIEVGAVMIVIRQKSWPPVTAR